MLPSRSPCCGSSELQGWSPALFNPQAGGGGALVGIVCHSRWGRNPRSRWGK
jgi:hypothetical protein